MLLLVHVEAGLHMLDQLHLVHLEFGTLCEKVHLEIVTLCEKEEKLVLTDDGPIGQFDASAPLLAVQIDPNR